MCQGGNRVIFNNSVGGRETAWAFWDAVLEEKNLINTFAQLHVYI